MAGNANSVNIENAKRGYHHGDLRSALVQAGLEMLKTRSADEVSLREIARMVGVSATAVYRHFPDKAALLGALCDEGGRELARLQVEAMRKSGGGRPGFDAVGRAYVRFALDNPTLFRMMMTTKPAVDFLDIQPDRDNSALQLLRDNISTLVPAGATPAQRRIAALRAWSIVHGLAMLMLDKQVAVDETVIDAVIDSASAGIAT
ncbi:MAG: TetR/AcrR family transcriptional regulator [Sphingorhabdus sp.]